MKLWQHLSAQEQKELKDAYKSGKAIEWSYGLPWKTKCSTLEGSFTPVWSDDICYRVCDLARETTVGSYCRKGTSPKSHYVYQIEFDIVNGHPDWSTAKVTGL